jgi:flavin-dependent dehydrogenase
MDRRLRDLAVAAGGEVRERSRVPREAVEGRVWAAGRIPRRGRWVGLKVHVRGMEMASDLEMHLGENGYAGVAGVEDGRVNVCGLFRVDRSMRQPDSGLLLSYLEAGGVGGLAERMAAAGIDEESFCAVAGFELGRQPAAEDLCVVGDSESMIPPFTGNGMSMAFQAAEVAAAPLAEWSGGRLAWDDCRRRVAASLESRFRRRLRAAAAMHPLLLGRPGRRLLQVLSAAHLLPFRPLLSLVR